MLPTKRRLSKNRDVKTAIARGRAFFNPLFTVKFRASKEPARFTVVVSTKVSKKAVDRNRIKRVLREAIRLTIEGFRSGDYAILVKTTAKKVEAGQLRKDFLSLATKSGLLRVY